MLCALLSVSGFCGCRDPEPAVYETRGTLTINGLAVSNASLALHRADGDATAACPVAITRDDGTFTFSTHAPDDGAPPGEYIVTLIWHDDSAPIDECECIDPVQHDLLKGRYADARTSHLRASIRREANDLRIEATAPRASDTEHGVGSFFGPPPERTERLHGRTTLPRRPDL